MSPSSNARDISLKYIKMMQTMTTDMINKNEQPEDIFKDYNTVYTLISEEMTQNNDSSVFFNSLHLSSSLDIIYKIIENEFNSFKKEISHPSLTISKSWLSSKSYAKFISLLVNTL